MFIYLHGGDEERCMMDVAHVCEVLQSQFDEATDDCDDGSREQHEYRMLHHIFARHVYALRVNDDCCARAMAHRDVVEYARGVIDVYARVK